MEITKSNTIYTALYFAQRECEKMSVYLTFVEMTSVKIFSNTYVFHSLRDYVKEQKFWVNSIYAQVF